VADVARLATVIGVALTVTARRAPVSPRRHCGSGAWTAAGARGRCAAEMALAVVALGSSPAAEESPQPVSTEDLATDQPALRLPLAEATHAAGRLPDAAAVEAWRHGVAAEEPRLDRDPLARAIARRSSVRNYAASPLPRANLADLLAWSEAAIPADAPRVVRQVVSVAAVGGLPPGIYKTALEAERLLAESELQECIGRMSSVRTHESSIFRSCCRGSFTNSGTNETRLTSVPR
jgi:hypothetical protein